MKCNNLVLCSYGLCNLKCSYCTIDKNKYLAEVDKELENSYVNFEKEYVPRIKKHMSKDMTTLEFWGGEPLLGIERVTPVIDYVVNNYPKFNFIFISTNFSYDTWVDKVYILINELAKFKFRKFLVKLQLSVDGVEDINDRNRGKGTTKKCIENINKLVNAFKTYGVPKNIKIEIFNKSTLSVCDLNGWMQSKEGILNHYHYIEDTFIMPFYNLNIKNIDAYCGCPNFAVPTPASKEHGLLFANMLKICSSIDTEKEFKLTHDIMPMKDNAGQKRFSTSSTSLCHGCTTCGNGVYRLNLLPKGRYALCHMAYGQFADGYRKYASITNSKNDSHQVTLDEYIENTKIDYIYSEKEVPMYEDTMKSLTRDDDTSYSTVSIYYIQTLAEAGQIDSKYKDFKEASIAFNKLKGFNHCCIFQNACSTHSVSTPPIYELRLFLNGALDYICDIGSGDN